MSVYHDHDIELAINGNRFPTANSMIAYRQMLAMEEIAKSLETLEEILRHTDPVRLLPSPAPDDPEAKWSEPMNLGVATEAVGPALQHRRGRRVPVAGE